MLDICKHKYKIFTLSRVAIRPGFLGFVRGASGWGFVNFFFFKVKKGILKSKYKFMQSYMFLVSVNY